MLEPDLVAFPLAIVKKTRAVVTSALRIQCWTAAAVRAASNDFSDEVAAAHLSRVYGLERAGEQLKAEWNTQLQAYERHVAAALAACRL